MASVFILLAFLLADIYQIVNRFLVGFRYRCGIGEELHGPYWYLFTKKGGKSEYVGKSRQAWA